MELSIIILNYKTKGLLKQCLRGIFSSHWPFPHEVIVVDNDSQDGSYEMVKEQFPSVQAISNPNIGFAGGMNVGFRAAQGKYLLILNPDVAVFGEAVAQLRDYLEANQSVGMAAPKLINPDGTTQYSCYLFPNIWIPALRRTPLGKLPAGRQMLRKYLMTHWKHDQNQPVGWVLGACVLIRRSALDQVGMFDERFFLYFEDVDLCRRFWQAGWEVHYVASAEIVHYHQRLSAENSGLQGLFSYPTRVHIQSAFKYYAKYLGAKKAPHSL